MCARVSFWPFLCAKINEILRRFQGLSLASDMKPAHHTLFRDQVSTLVEWFANWNDCEQTIALYTLLKRISTIQARFLSLILEHTFRDNSLEVQMMQRRANDKGNIFLSGARGRVNSGLSCSARLVRLRKWWLTVRNSFMWRKVFLLRREEFRPFVIDTHLQNSSLTTMIACKINCTVGFNV